jgi:homopolymeric O-antigen transport system permease protein
MLINKGNQAISSIQKYTAPNFFANFAFKAALADILEGLLCWKIWIALSWQEFQSQYRRSIFGVAWVILSFLFFIFVKLIIFTSLLPTADQIKYNAYLVTGFYIWFFLITSVNAAPNTFITQAGWIRSEKLPLSTYVFKSIMREFYNTALTSIVVAFAFLYLRFGITWQALYSIPALIFLIINTVWIKVMLGIIAARYRDITFLVQSISLPMMFLTPIFWMPEQMAPKLMEYLWWNPFFHYLEIFRAPLIGDGVPITSWIFVLVLFGIGNCVALVLFARFRQRIVFWL